ncbi:transglycosylase domain-containing protein [Prauserella rugosa]|uniref:Membrane peptidoglycan carboxypeptidase n=1 Tax=Prauserella rugosa TaxID=43354 RepID=A0A660CKS8_9PSEU|nr:transglycosylase domain-containing protein [Prauserella rugosa]TWH21635.1 membrane peptidoglycan carboxypeptidase [Prauserella rugosa]
MPPAGAPQDPTQARRQPPPRRPEDPRRAGGPDDARRQPPRRPEDRRPEGRPGDRTQQRPGAGGAAAAGGVAGAAGGYAAGRMDEPREPELITHQSMTGTGRGYDPYDDRYDSDPYGYDPDGFTAGGAAADGATVAAAHAEGGYDDADPDEGAGKRGKKDKALLTPAQRKKRRWRRVRRTLYACVGVFVVLPALAFVVTYFFVDVPTPEEVAAQQGKIVSYYYAGGEKMAEDAPPEGRRVILKPDDIPPVMRYAAYAAEDATFESNSGFDITGIVRAAWNQVKGGAGGGSTISQQYIKVATENDDYSLTRKWTEIVKSFKMNNEQSKDEIITAYLNTIYFGRGAYGVETAAQSYFGKSAKDLNASQAALLAGMIQQPGRSEDEQVRNQRWAYVADQMVANGWLNKSERESMQPPKLIKEGASRPEALDGPDAFIKNRVMAELAAKGYSEEKIQTGGYKIYTTIDKRAQNAAKKSVNDVMQGEPGELRKSLVAVDPKSGSVRAYYGGPNEAGVDEMDWGNVQRNPGSSFKPFDFVALLQQGKGGLYSTYDGTSPRQFGRVTIANAEGTECGEECTVEQAMARSINTVFYDMVTNTTGPKAVMEAAMAAGIPEKHGDKPTMGSLDGNISIGGGQTQVTPTDMAGAYATFAADGIQRDTHFVAKLETSDGEVLFDETTPAAKKGEPAFDPDEETNRTIARNVTESLKGVLPEADLSCPSSHECAGKTGTHQYDQGDPESSENSQAWMVGYSPQISAAAWVGTGGGEPIRDATGSPIYGSGLPAEIWQEFMANYLEPLEPEPFSELEEVLGPQPPVVDDAPEETTEETTTEETTTEESTTEESSRPETTQPSSPPPGPPSRPSEPSEPTDTEEEDDDGGGPIWGRPPEEPQGNGNSEG